MNCGGVNTAGGLVAMDAGEFDAAFCRLPKNPCEAGWPTFPVTDNRPPLVAPSPFLWPPAEKSRCARSRLGHAFKF